MFFLKKIKKQFFSSFSTIRVSTLKIYESSLKRLYVEIKRGRGYEERERERD